ncbi:hypothetical protein PMAYCL1PPCAC_26436 [Pristionchus mayeri]|uniref:Uncharacterized protein n=1 Tax=Pristionchus mayeri TaxID=1317129 RepID=A0AAN5D3N3_9BILA|nr:hypothetical protein PMAYCL1PPCAC_26436 [Pristionchus mayeri]
MVRSLFQLLQFQDHEVCKFAIVALVHVTYKSDNIIAQRKLVHDSGILPLVFKLLDDDDDELVEDALTVLLNIAAGDDALMQSVIDLGTLRVLPEIMENKANYPWVIKNCCWLIKNLMAGTKDHIQEIISNGLLPKIVKIMQTGDSGCQKQCCWALHNLLHKGTKTQILALVDQKPMPALSAVLTHTDLNECIDNALDVINELLSTVNGKKLTTLKHEMKTTGVHGHLKKLRENTNEEVRNLANKILSEYFAENDEEETNEKLRGKEDDKAKKMVQKRKRACQ